MSQRGQILLILLLVMAVGLGVGLSVIQRSVSDISTASKVEQSSRAFSAAEAGIERALQGGSCGVNCINFTGDNSAKADVSDTGLVPPIPSSGPQVALEYPPLSKEQTAHFWLTDYSVTPLTSSTYTASSVDVYWGKSPQDPNTPAPAIELTVISWNGLSYQNSIPKKTYDPDAATRQNGFATADCSEIAPKLTDTIMGSGRKFYCKQNVTIPANTIMIRARLLYSSTNQPIAVRGVGTCGQPCSLPPQARVYTSSGTAGSSQRTVQLFRLEKVVPPYLDYAIFSAGDISK